MSEDTNRIERECIGCKAFLGARFDEKEETRRDEDKEQLQPVEGGFKSEQTGKSPGFGLRAREKVRCGWDHNTVEHLRPSTCTVSVPSLDHSHSLGQRIGVYREPTNRDSLASPPFVRL